MLMVYRAITADSGTNTKYESLKNRLIQHANRMRKSAKHDRRRNFDKSKMKSGETVFEYALRLETAAREKFGDDQIDLNDHELFKKFLDTIPDHIRTYFNKQRKERKRLDLKQFSWQDVLQELEENEWGKEKLDKDIKINMGTQQLKEYGSYREAVMASITNEKQTQRDYDIQVVVDYIMKQKEQEQQGQSMDRNYSRHIYQNRGNTNYQRREYSQKTESPQRYIEGGQRCTYCHRMGHSMEKCRFRLGLCLRCGEADHRIKDCGNQIQGCGDKEHSLENCPKNGSVSKMSEDRSCCKKLYCAKSSTR